MVSSSRILSLASVVVDYVYQIPALPEPSGEQTARYHERLVGGGFNMMVAARRNGIKVAFAGQHGVGPDGDLVRAALKREKIALLSPPNTRGDTGNSVVLLTDDAERTFVSWPGVDAQPDGYGHVLAEATDYVFMSGYSFANRSGAAQLLEWLESASSSNLLFFDPTPVCSEIHEDDLKHVLHRTNWLSCNEKEACVIAGSGSCEEMARLILGEHCPIAQGVIIRAGRGGCHVRLRSGESYVIPGFKVDAVDTNGAGDTHIGAFMSALALDMHPFEAARFANAAAAISVTRRGGANAPSRKETLDFLSQEVGT